MISPNPTLVPGAIVHGGNLREAVRRYGISFDAWLDLSTGINPHAYPVPPIPAEIWRRLPDDGDGLLADAARYYGAPSSDHITSVAGSQAAIRALPELLQRGVAAVAPLTYGEYAPAFERAGHTVVPLDIDDDVLPCGVNHAVVVTPNNPTTKQVDPHRLLQWHAQLSAVGGTLIVDETFGDALPAETCSSMAAYVDREGLVVLRSPGKFFGLAGARCGFALGRPELLAALRLHLGAWTVNGPARHAVAHAFRDHAWQHQMRVLLASESARLVALLQAHGLVAPSTPLFAWFPDPRAEALHQGLARQGIWTRYFSAIPSVRFGLPGLEQEWARLELALARTMDELSKSTNGPIRKSCVRSLPD